jgi:hypothetical protein
MEFAESISCKISKENLRAITSITTRPTLWPPTVISKKTLGLDMIVEKELTVRGMK